MRSFATSGGVLALCLFAVGARAAQVTYSFSGREPAHAKVEGGGESYDGFRLAPGHEIEARVDGPGVLRLVFFQDYVRGRHFPGTVRLMVSLDREQKMSALSPKPQSTLSYRPAMRGGVRPSEAMPVLLKVPAGTHTLTVRLPPGEKLGGTVAFSNATRKADDLDLGLGPVASNAPAPAGDDLALPDLDLAPAEPKKAAKPSDDLDLDLGLGPAPAKTASAKKPTPSDDFDLGLTLPPPPAKAKVAERGKPPPPHPESTETLVASSPNEPPESAFVVEAPPPPPKPHHRRKALAKVAPPAPPPQLGNMEVGVRAGWAMSRGELAGGQGVYLAEIGYRLTAEGHPNLRAVFTTGYTLLTGGWTGIEPGRGLGGFTQATTLVPMELGLTWEPTGPGGASPYLGVAVSSGVANTAIQRFSLPAATATGASMGVTAELGLRLQAGMGSFVFELRHTESMATLLSLSNLGQSLVSATGLTGGYSYSF